MNPDVIYSKAGVRRIQEDLVNQRKQLWSSDNDADADLSDIGVVCN